MKVCGLTDPDDARDAVDIGADMIGMIFARSKRKVSVEQAREIVFACRPAITVGVFVNSEPDEINEIMDQTGIAMVQLHGDEPPEYLPKINRPCIKVFRIYDTASVVAISTWFAHLDTKRPTSILLDTYDPKDRGGTGRIFNWDLVAHANHGGELSKLAPIILSGGLNPDNVAEGIEKIGPWGVDVSSGVEFAPGCKDLNLLEKFIDEVF